MQDTYKSNPQIMLKYFLNNAKNITGEKPCVDILYIFSLMLQTPAYVPVGTTDHSELSKAFWPKDRCHSALQY